MTEPQHELPTINYEDRERPLLPRKLRWSDNIDRDIYDRQETPRESSGLATANLITSEASGLEVTHYPVIDIDVPHLLVPSSRPGHSHLYFEVGCTRRQYMNLLRAMRECGIVEAGYVAASEARGYSAVRLPWVRKRPAPQPPVEMPF